MEWIKFEDKKPEEHIPILIFCENGQQHVGMRDNYLGDGNYLWLVGGFRTCDYCGGECYIVFVKYPHYEDVLIGTHWMPLPKDPVDGN